MIVGDQRDSWSPNRPNPATVSAAQFLNKEWRAIPPWLPDRREVKASPPMSAMGNHQAFALLPEDFTFDNGSLTFTLKLSAAS